MECNRGVIVNEYLETSAPDIWAAGDCAEFNDLVLGERSLNGTWVNAQMQGRTAALNMIGGRQAFRLAAFYTAHGFGINVGSAGNPWPVPGRECVYRGGPDTGWREAFVFKGPKLMGATSVGRTDNINVMVRLIDKGLDLTPHRASLADPNFDLKTLLK